jgi:hypothetical protein
LSKSYFSLKCLAWQFCAFFIAVILVVLYIPYWLCNWPQAVEIITHIAFITFNGVIISLALAFFVFVLVFFICLCSIFCLVFFMCDLFCLLYYWLFFIFRADSVIGNRLLSSARK